MQMVAKPLRINDDILPIGEAKANLSRILREMGEHGRPVVITQNGRPTGVVITPAEYDRLVYAERVREAIREGLAQSEEGAGYTTDQVMQILNRDLDEFSDE